MSKTPRCAHRRAIIVRGGILKPGERRDPSEAAWCPDCPAFREAAAGNGAEPWLYSYEEAIAFVEKREGAA